MNEWTGKTWINYCWCYELQNRIGNTGEIAQEKNKQLLTIMSKKDSNLCLGNDSYFPGWILSDKDVTSLKRTAAFNQIQHCFFAKDIYKIFNKINEKQNQM